MNISGVQAIHQALQVTAGNIANAATPGFEPSRVIFQAAPSGQVQAHVDHPRTQPAGRRNPGDDSDGERPSGTDLTEETVNVVTLRHAYTANLKAIQAESEELGILIDTVA